MHEARRPDRRGTLGKLIVRGPDAGELLDRLYPNRRSNLKPGRIRYGVVTSDGGRIVDDGTVCRLDDERVLRHDDVERRRRDVRVVRLVARPTGACDVDLTDVTQGLGAVNLAGPRAREILAEVTDLDCSPEAFTVPRRQARGRWRACRA